MGSIGAGAKRDAELGPAPGAVDGCECQGFDQHLSVVRAK